VVIPLLSVTHGQCDARPKVTFPADADIFILHGDRPTPPSKFGQPVVRAKSCFSVVAYSGSRDGSRVVEVGFRKRCF